MIGAMMQPRRAAEVQSGDAKPDGPGPLQQTTL